MQRHHVIQVTDLHLSAERAYNYPGWAACLAHVNRERPDLVVATGDFVLCDPDHAPDHAFVRSELGRIEVPWAALPGNHDVGDSGPRPYMGQWITPERRQRYLGHFGTDRWIHELGRWRLVGINAQLLGSGLEAEVEQQDWLRAALAEGGGRPVALFLHKPLFIHGPGEEDDPSWSVTRRGRAAILELLSAADVRLVACGHAHHYRTLMAGGIAMVWAPSTSQVMSNEVPPFQAPQEPGVVHYWFADDRVEFGLMKPAGLTPRDVTGIVERHGAMRHAPALPLAAVAATGF
jgi:3',5'-cyclic AMP phosphodiesterase CpdA